MSKITKSESFLQDFFGIFEELCNKHNSYASDKDANFNLWNFDLSYSWWFAPGSQMSILYRNNAATFDRNINKNFNSNFSNLFNDNLSHVLSFSVRYFIDYKQAKNWIKKG